jgi:7-cyano-7-deazaguanine synthase
MTLAANRAAAWGIRDIFTGLCQADYGGYPDCEQPFVDKMADAISQGLWANREQLRFHTPLMDLSKAESVKLAAEVLGDKFAEVFKNTHTCYAGVKGGCGKCHACILRDKGFRDAGVPDPLWVFRAVAV